MPLRLDVYATISAKRDGQALSEATWRQVVEAFLSGDMADYQMSALLMAVTIRGMEPEETAALTRAMIDSGERLDLAGLGTVVDKHSTGGVGDKTTLVLAPLVAAAGLKVAKMSGRGLGHTGGTIDKLEAIPGFRTDLGARDFKEQVERLGVAVIAQRPELVPADRELYALRDVTATVESIPLIAASIVSKKAAGGAAAVVFDVKTGSGAFMRRRGEAEELGHTLVSLAGSLGLRAEAVLTDMDQPLGRAVGNAIEVAEAVETLSGEGPDDLREVVLTLAARMIALGSGTPVAEARTVAEGLLDKGAALDVFRDWVEAQGGDPRVADRGGVLPVAPVVQDVQCPTSGHVTRLDALAVGRAAMLLGAGRRTKGDVIDPRVGVECLAKIGDRVAMGQSLFIVHAAEASAVEVAREALCGAVDVGDAPLAPRRPVLADPLV